MGYVMSRMSRVAPVRTLVQEAPKEPVKTPSSLPNSTEGQMDQSKPIRNVLVVGGAGFVGSVLIPKLLDRGYHVRVMDSLVYGDEGIRHLNGRPRYEMVDGDLRSLESIVR